MEIGAALSFETLEILHKSTLHHKPEDFFLFSFLDIIMTALYGTVKWVTDAIVNQIIYVLYIL
jgi:hypothetical protein